MEVHNMTEWLGITVTIETLFNHTLKIEGKLEIGES